MIQENRYIKLSDVSETGETWDKLKASSITVGEILKSSANLSFQRRGVRIAGGLYLRNQRNKDGKFHPMAVWDETAGCSSFLKGVFTKPLEEKGRRFRTTEVYRCNDRLCPICQKVKSIRLTFKALQRMSYIEAKEQLLPPAQRHKYIFLTLTVENCAVVNLRETILMMNKAFRRLQSYPFWKKYVAGYIRKMEVTRNHKDGTAHPHFHVLFMVTPDYFDHQKPQVSQDEYCLIWQQAMELNYKPICDVRLVKPNWKKGKNTIRSALDELLKYALKFDKALVEAPEWLLEYASQIHKLRAFFSGGLLKDVIKETLTAEEEALIDKAMEEGNPIDEDYGIYWFKFWNKYQQYTGHRLEP